MSEEGKPILYVIVVGFHHKKGCQVEYSFPPLVAGSPNECPEGWKYLPTLALPDGSHNYDEDTVYFHLPSLTNSKKTVYGISCFRQIPVEKIKNLTADITRGTVQKSVCVLSKLPLYGHIQVKMSLITHAYFDEGDFSKVSLLEDTYHHLNSVLLQNDLSSQTFVGLSARDFILQWKHKAVLLFKLLLLEKRIVFYKTPVQSLSSTILALLSLHPGMIERGLNQSSCIKPSRPMSPMPYFSDEDLTPTSSPKTTSPQKSLNNIPLDCNIINTVSIDESKHCVDILAQNNEHVKVITVLDSDEDLKKNDSTEIGMEVTESIELNSKLKDKKDEKNTLVRDGSSEVVGETIQNAITQLAQIDPDSCGFPLPIFTKGYLCLPYLSLPYMDLLSDVNVRGYVVGATNVLFKQKRQLSDILVEIDGCRIECQDPELRKQLHLTTEDLRFADYIVKHVAEERHDVFLDGVGWEGGDEWIRTQFRVYLLCLLRTSLLPDGSREIEHFGTNFVSNWRETHNYKMWLSKTPPTMLNLTTGHPFAGQLSVSDMKLRLAHTMQNTESGRKLNQAMASTGRAVATTSKAVGGALSQAKGAFSSWWTNLLVSPEPLQKGLEATNEIVNQDEVNEADQDGEDVLDNSNNSRNLINGSIINVNKNEESNDINITEECSKENMKAIDLDNHEPGMVHTV